MSAPWLGTRTLRSTIASREASAYRGARLSVWVFAIWLLSVSWTLAAGQGEAAFLDEPTVRADSGSTVATTVGGGGLAFLFGAFCALWAQQTRRNPWLWFFLGFFLTVIAVLVLLWKNANEPRPPS